MNIPIQVHLYKQYSLIHVSCWLCVWEKKYVQICSWTLGVLWKIWKSLVTSHDISLILDLKQPSSYNKRNNPHIKMVFIMYAIQIWTVYIYIYCKILQLQLNSSIQHLGSRVDIRLDDRFLQRVRGPIDPKAIKKKVKRFLVGGWTNPSEKYERQNGNLPHQWK